MCRVLLSKAWVTEDDEMIQFLLVPEDQTHLWNYCECCPSHAKLKCPRCKQVRD